MAVICYASTGSNTFPYETWAKAATSLATALAAATSGDTVQLDMANIAAADAEVAGTTTWTLLDETTLHVGTQSGASGITTGIMGTTYWLGNSTTNRALNLRVAANGEARIVGGITLRSVGGQITICSANANVRLHADEVYLWHSGSASALCEIGHTSECNVMIGKLTIDEDDTTPTLTKLNISGDVTIGYLQADIAGSLSAGFLDSGGFYVNCNVLGGDISSIGSGLAICNDFTNGVGNITLANVVLNASFVMMDTQTNANVTGANLWLRDCSSSGSAVPFAYANACGEVRVDTGIYLTAGVAGYSAKITTKAACSAANPFLTPWFNEYKAAATVNLSSEVLRDGSSTAYTDAQFWKETLTKETTSSVVTTFSSTRGTGTNIPAGAGTGSWTGESGTAWSGEITRDSVTLDVDGFVRQRFGAAVASSTIYVDIGPIT